MDNQPKTVGEQVVNALEPIRLRKETIKSSIDRCWCDFCGHIIRVDDVVFWDRETSATYCSLECAKADPVNTGREVVEDQR